MPCVVSTLLSLTPISSDCIHLLAVNTSQTECPPLHLVSPLIPAHPRPSLQAGTESLSRTGTRRDPSEPRFIRVADLQQIFTSNKMLPMAARCLEEATHWNHPGAHHAVVQASD